MNEIFSLDVETKSLDKRNPQYALEPYRQPKKQVVMTSVAVAGPDSYIKQITDMNELPSLLRFLKGKVVYAHNALFDVAFNYYHIDFDTLKSIKWRDTMLAAKWLINGQGVEYGRIKCFDSDDRFSFALRNLVGTFIKDHPLLEEFLDLKLADVKPGENFEYWLRRGRLDAILTRELAIKLQTKMPESQRRGFLIEQRAIPYVTRSWLYGIDLDYKGALQLNQRIDAAHDYISKELGIPKTVFTSTKQLGHYLFKTLGLPPISRSKKTGNPSTSKDDLKMLHHKYAETKFGPKIKRVLDYKQLATTKSKFTNGIIECYNYHKESKSYASPWMFSTYTGRFTYQSKLQRKHRVGIATHQLPRKGPVRSLLIAPEDLSIGELDAAAQEMRGMGQESGDQNIIDEFNNGVDLHSSMAAFIAGLPYEVFQSRYLEGDSEAENFRYAGKLLNLSCQYRIGWKSLQSKFFTTYSIVIGPEVARQYLALYKRRYPGVVAYWHEAPAKARKRGFAETIAGRRYYIDEWGSKSWQSESSAINFPVQGFGGDHKVFAIGELGENFPEAIFILDLHDGLFNLLPKGSGKGEDKELLLDMKHHLNSVDYSQVWQKDCKLHFPFDEKIGPSFGNLKAIE